MFLIPINVKITEILAYYKILQYLCIVIKNDMQMDDLTDDEKELIEMIRLLQQSKHNPSDQLLKYVRDLFESMID